MTFWEHFLRLLPRRPLPALEAFFWHLLCRRVRARNRLRVGSADLPFVYAAWINSNEREADVAKRCNSILQDSGWHPRFQVLLHAPDSHSDEQLARSRDSVERQVYPHWTINGNANWHAAETAGDADFVVPLRIGDQLASTALLQFAQAARTNRNASVFYGDEDYVDQRGRHRPWFKPQWNKEMFLALDYLSSCAAIDAKLAHNILAKNQPRNVSSLLLEAVSATEGAIVHLPHILCHVDPAVAQQSDRLSIVDTHIQGLGAKCRTGPFETVRVQWPLPETLPLVSIIIATRDKIEFLRPCVNGVLQRTDYRNFEVLIVDNGSVEKRTRDFLAEVDRHPHVRVLRFPGRFNFSAINNFAALQARGSFLCLLNNDTEVIDHAWLTELMRYAVRPEIGAAGAKLLYEDGSIQHAGIVIGIGEAAGHAHRFLAAGEPGYFRMPHVTQYVSAVTAACLVIERSKFDAVGGFDEEMAVAFNDVDFCLKVGAAGWRNVYVPHAVLLHHESKSRGKDEVPEKIERFRRELDMLQRRWGTKLYADPIHNPNLDRRSETFVIKT
jgi:O-antigen biosynthesis protein